MGCIDVDSMKARRETYGCSKTRVSQWEGVRTQKLINNNNNKVGIVGHNWLLSENESMGVPISKDFKFDQLWWCIICQWLKYSCKL